MQVPTIQRYRQRHRVRHGRAGQGHMTAMRILWNIESGMLLPQDHHDRGGFCIIPFM